ncbi:sulfurtransferase [Williamsia maris]|uniref:Thiosulfate/3-mercaptopyruvate sulfurtransferase n=1 Tax=Williamsia maris TaxID=72806 RepID=A0ABT1H9M0_9NOCA|nr:sulfurtransferase [Williamsia maris]MCP2174944.1 thiosulfate/3-mercaptopyruvate sulfurtransferase [Williamsia maris]
MTDVTITADELRTRLAGTDPPVLLDVRWQLGDDRGDEHYRDAHIPGAIYVDLNSDLASPAGPQDGRHPLPGIAALQDTARRWGIDADSTVVAYDDNGNQAAARAWWLLRWAGLTDVVLLDGGLRSWRHAGFDLASGDETASSQGGVILAAGHAPTVDVDEVATTDGILLDARAGERYRGENEPVDPRAGHIPGALSAPTSDNLNGEGRFRSPEELRTRFAALGVEPGTPTTVYCGSGVTAAHQIAALAIAGIDATLYPGSWSQWSADPRRPAATGDEPG